MRQARRKGQMQGGWVVGVKGRVGGCVRWQGAWVTQPSISRARCRGMADLAWLCMVLVRDQLGPGAKKTTEGHLFFIAVQQLPHRDPQRRLATAASAGQLVSVAEPAGGVVSRRPAAAGCLEEAGRQQQSSQVKHGAGQDWAGRGGAGRGGRTRGQRTHCQAQRRQHARRGAATDSQGKL